MSLRSLGLITVFLSTTLLLAACESSEQRAQKHFESGIALLEEGDVDRAFVEFRNVLKLNPRHKEARLEFARSQIAQGNTKPAYRQYSKLVEYYPDNLEGHVVLSEIAILDQNLEAAERHALAAKQLDAQNQRAIVVVTAIDYVKARRGSDDDVAAEQAETLTKYLVQDPSNAIARRIVIEHLTNVGDFDNALPAIEEGLEFEPDDFEMLMAKLRLQAQSQDQAGAEKTLRLMVAKFPENEDLQRMLIAFYLESGDLDGAETFLRELTDAPDAEPGAKMVVVQFLALARSKEAARAELDRLIEEGDDTIIYRVLLASMDYEEGKTAEAIADIETLMADAEPSEETNNSKVVLARMLIGTGNPVGARARIEEVLTDDPNHVEALKMQAAWLIEEDEPGKAIVALRNALEGAPRDADIMTLLGQAHERAGARELAGERYAVAVEVSDSAPTESLRYAAFLVGDERVEAAVTVLQEALSRAPENIELLRNLAALRIRQQDWNRATRVVWSLRAMDTDESNAAANRIEAEVLSRQERTEETIAFLKGLVDEGDSDIATLSALIMTQARDGQLEAATEVLEKRLADEPENPDLRFLRAGMYTLSNENDKAEAEYRKLLDEFPGSDRVLNTYYNQLVASGRDDEAGALIEEILAQDPDAWTALLIKASRLERAKDFEGAIEIYEGLYARNSGNLIFANNLASMITTHRTDAESLDRAFTIASRLRETPVPPFQDTFGWIEYRRGNYDDALAYLEPAAKGLPDDPFVQYHLAMTYVALERVEEARVALTNTLKLAGDASLPQFESAREELAKLPEVQ